MEAATTDYAEQKVLVMKKIDELLSLCGQRNLISSTELADALLDMRLIYKDSREEA